MEGKNNLVCTKQSVENLVKIVEMSLRMVEFMYFKYYFVVFSIVN